jgi:hypothetical protein
MTRTYEREPIIYPELGRHQKQSSGPARSTYQTFLWFAQIVCIIFYGLMYPVAAVNLNLIPLAWSWVILLIIYLPFIVLYSCDTQSKERTNWDGTTEERTGWPFRIALVSACIPPIAIFCFLAGVLTGSSLRMSLESAYVLSIEFFVAFVCYAIYTHRWLNN